MKECFQWTWEHRYLFEALILFTTLDIYLEEGLLDQMVLYSLVLRSSCSLSWWLYQFIFPNTVNRCSLFYTFSLTWHALFYSLFDNNSSASKCEVISHCNLFFSFFFSVFSPVSGLARSYFSNQELTLQWKRGVLTTGLPEFILVVVLICTFLKISNVEHLWY